MQKPGISGDDEDNARSPVWKLSIDDFERAVEDETHPLHEDAVVANREIGVKLSAALAPITKSTFSGMEQALANIARHAIGVIDWDAPLRKLSVNLAPDFQSSEEPVVLRLHDPGSDVDIISQVAENTTMGGAFATLEGKLDEVVGALQQRASQADRHSGERRDESEGASAIAKRSLAISRVSLLAAKRTLSVSVWMLVAGTIAAVSGVGAIVVGIMTLASTSK